MFGKKKKKEKAPRILEGMDPEWIGSLPGEEYAEQNEHVRAGIAAKIGTREHQEDAAAVRWIGESLVVAMVCDGMGGLSNGDAASRAAIGSVMSGIEAALQEGTLSSEGLFGIVRDANETVREIGDDETDAITCGTTMTLLIIRDDLAVWMSVGDSRIYYLSEKGLRCITKEHNYTLMTEMRKDEAGFSPDPRIRMDSLVSFLGAPEVRYIDYNTMPWKLRDGDVFLLCSDGLPRLMDDSVMEGLLLGGEEDPDALAGKLAEEASSNAVMRQDNTTVVIVKYKE